jgi:mono/diheme cytochrome c family protein
MMQGRFRPRHLPKMLMALFAPFVFGQNTSYRPSPDWQPPPEAAARINPLAKKPQAAAGGKKMYSRECVECHGEDGRGLAKKHSADFQLPAVQSQSDGALFWKITNGNPDRGMPAFSRLPEMQRWQLVLFIRTLRTDTTAGSPAVEPK